MIRNNPPSKKTQNPPKKPFKKQKTPKTQRHRKLRANILEDQDNCFRVIFPSVSLVNEFFFKFKKKVD